jgi:hypothetical protein
MEGGSEMTTDKPLTVAQFRKALEALLGSPPKRNSEIIGRDVYNALATLDEPDPASAEPVMLWRARQNQGQNFPCTLESRFPVRIATSGCIEFELEPGKWSNGNPSGTRCVPNGDMAPGEIRWIGPGPDPRVPAQCVTPVCGAKLRMGDCHLCQDGTHIADECVTCHQPLKGHPKLATYEAAIAAARKQGADEALAEVEAMLANVLAMRKARAARNGRKT